MAYEEIKFKKSKVVKNKPKPKSKHIKTADLGSVLPFLSDNLGTIVNIGTGAMGVIGGLAGYEGWKIGSFRRRQDKLRRAEHMKRWGR